MGDPSSLDSFKCCHCDAIQYFTKEAKDNIMVETKHICTGCGEIFDVYALQPRPRRIPTLNCTM